MSRLRVARLFGRRRAEPPGRDAETADAVLRLAVLLEAGVPAARAWPYVRPGASAESPSPAAIAELGGAWRAVGAAWSVSAAVGAPLADSLRAIAAALRDAQETADQVRVTLAEPAGTARLMAWLPLVAVALGSALGFDTVSVLVGSPAGWACGTAGLLCMVGARRWSARLVRRAGTPEGIPGLRAELSAIALRGGVSVERAEGIVGTALASAGIDEPATGDESHADADILTLSREAGVPAVELLRATAVLARHRVRTEGRLRAAKLASHLLIPLGVCTLPAFLLLGVAPMLLSVLGTTALNL
ncbi:pilus assembly protein TadB [Microbacterium rhizosphaerae]|uniref:Pilus assembly protein TadB n=1 Tax=Microbacterium rhizosphaerae TaxID=1678237 RepID=A0ABZ0SNN1_9MICO|nr:pilus assembly protein TadB [Microbacterium rhizosphaerae]WPR88891.1 pilus assembly protein TadB [Microbacterium rhizosphaerae]